MSGRVRMEPEESHARSRTHAIHVAVPLSAVVAVEDREVHLSAVAIRIASHDGPGSDRLRARATAMDSAAPPEQRQRLLDLALRARTLAQRIFWLRREADAVVDAARPISPCATGCSHCCHTDVAVAEAEARVIGQAIGRPTASLPQALQIGVEFEANVHAFRDRFVGESCVFLEAGRCAIYRHRPLACRKLVSLDDDALLCRLVPGQPIEVPYLNVLGEDLAYAVAVGVNAKVADIREWFPMGR